MTFAADTEGPARDAAALVLSTDPVAAALVGALLETLAFEPRFASPDESARAALRRHRPRVVLLDCEHGEACAPGFLGPAAMLGTPVVLFGGARCADLLDGVAAQYGLHSILFPADAATVGRVIGEALTEPR